MSRDDDDDRPRRSAKQGKRRKKTGPTALPWVIAGGAVLVLGGVGYLAVQTVLGTKSAPPAAGPIAANGPAPAGNGEAGPQATVQSPPARPPVPPAGGSIPRSGVKYVPHESEKKFMAYREANPDKPLTDAEVFAVMGDPTRVDPPETVVKNGVRITIYDAYWEVPNSGITSEMGFCNGVECGSVIGLKVTPRK